MDTGIQVVVEDGFARIEFLDKSKKGATLAALIAAGGTEMIDLDTSGTRRTYIVPESIAVQAGLLDDVPVEKAPVRRRRASSAAVPD